YRSQVRQRKDVAAADRPPCDLSGRGRRPTESCLRTAVAQGSTSEQMSDRLPPIALQSQRGTARSIDGLPLAFLLHADVKMISPLGDARNDRRSNFANCTFIREFAVRRLLITVQISSSQLPVPYRMLLMCHIEAKFAGLTDLSILERNSVV